MNEFIDGGLAFVRPGTRGPRDAPQEQCLLVPGAFGWDSECWSSNKSTLDSESGR